MLYVKNCFVGNMMVVIDNGFGGVIFYEVCGYFLEVILVVKGNFVFVDKLG